MTHRHPGGRTCRKMLPLALLMLPYAVVREVVYQRRAGRGQPTPWPAPHPAPQPGGPHPRTERS